MTTQDLICPHCHGVVGQVSQAERGPRLSDSDLVERVRAYVAGRPNASVTDVRAAVGGKLARVSEALRVVRAQRPAAPPADPLPSPVPTPAPEPPAVHCTACGIAIDGTPVPVYGAGEYPLAYCLPCAKKTMRTATQTVAEAALAGPPISAPEPTPAPPLAPKPKRGRKPKAPANDTWDFGSMTWDDDLGNDPETTVEPWDAPAAARPAAPKPPEPDPWADEPAGAFAGMRGW